jgi:putative nucleotidyltransferase with HDIG domain
LLNVLGDSWFSIGAAAVLTAGGSPTAADAAAPLLVGALAAQLAVDAGMAVVRERAHGGMWSREQIAELGWVCSVDAMLAPVGFALALAAGTDPLAVMLSWPVFLLLALFARERDDRLSSLLELSDAYRGTARVLGQFVEHDDPYTGLHVRGVAELALEVAEDIGLDERRRRLVEFGALLHDVGKIAIPNEIINKPGSLDAAEWELIKTHTLEGQRMLESIGGLMSEVGQIVRSSHERWDGSGYPDGLSGEEIPIESRIVFCCDAFNAMTTDRSYRLALTLDEAVAELREHAGTQFDPNVVEIVLSRVVQAEATQRGNVTALHPARLRSA